MAFHLVKFATMRHWLKPVEKWKLAAMLTVCVLCVLHIAVCTYCIHKTLKRLLDALSSALAMICLCGCDTLGHIICISLLRTGHLHPYRDVRTECKKSLGGSEV